MKVRVYRNLRDKCWSVMENGKVVGHAGYIVLADATFKVRESGRQRVIREQRKNVHAFVVGVRITPDKVAEMGWNKVQVKYNPYKMGCFYNPETNEPIEKAKAVVLSYDGTVGAYL